MKEERFASAILPTGEQVDDEGTAFDLDADDEHHPRAGNAVPDPARARGETLGDVVLRAWQTFARGSNIPRSALYWIGTMQERAR
jgi:hypothetical protein